MKDRSELMKFLPPPLMWFASMRRVLFAIGERHAPLVRLLTQRGGSISVES